MIFGCFFLLKKQISRVFQPNGACAAAAGNQAVRDLVCPFVFNNDFGEITVKYLTVFSLLVGLDNRCIDKRTVAVIIHNNSNTRDGKGVAEFEDGAVAGFANPKGDFRKSHARISVFLD